MNQNADDRNLHQVQKDLSRTAQEQLFSWGKPDGREKIKRFVRGSLLRQQIAPADGYNWPHALLAEGLLAAAYLPEEEASCLKRYYEGWLAKGQPLFYLDNAAHGMPLLDLYQRTRDGRYLMAAEKLVDYLRSYPVDGEGNLAYRQREKNRIFADGLGMICPFLIRYGVLTGEEKLLELGVIQLKNFLRDGMDAGSGLPYHGFDSVSKVKYGCIGWGRAVGWLMGALSTSLRCLPKEHPHRAQLAEALRQLTDAAFSCQRKDGGFSWQLPAMEGPADTSAAAMIGCAMLDAHFLIDDNVKMQDNLQRLTEFLLEHTREGKTQDASGECEGFSQYPQRYGSYPWSNGPALRFFRLIDKMM